MQLLHFFSIHPSSRTALTNGTELIRFMQKPKVNIFLHASCLHSLRKAERKTEIKNVNQMCSVPLCCNYLRKRQRKDMASDVV